MSEQKKKRDVITKDEIDVYLHHKHEAEILHDELLNRLENGAFIANDSQIELFVCEFNQRKIDWEVVARRLINRIYVSKMKIERYMARLTRAANIVHIVQLRSRNNNLYLPEAAREDNVVTIGG